MIETWFIPGKSPIKKDTIYREIPIDKHSGLRVCHFDENTIFKTYEFWSSDLLSLFAQAGIKRHTPPPYEKNCLATFQGANFGIAPQITSPNEDVKYVFRYVANANDAGKEAQSTNLIPFSATTDADAKVLYWFVNTSFVGKVPADQVFWWHTKPGNFVVRVVDDHGRSAVARDLKVESANGYLPLRSIFSID
jgi:penicillin-binding protein 1C